MFEAELVKKLNAITGLSGKVFPVVSPESTVAPYIVYYKRGGNDRKTFGGYNTNQSHGTFFIDIYHTTYKGMKTLSKSVADELKALNGQMMGSVFIQEITVSDTVELYEAEVYLYRGSIEIEVYYN